MLGLPLLNVRLRACSEEWAKMTPTAQGHHCGHCNRIILDFTQSSAADLKAAFQASPDGRVCGRFSPTQPTTRQSSLLPHLALRPQLKHFLVILLVCGLGLETQVAAQGRRAEQPTVKSYQAESKPAAITVTNPIESGLCSLPGLPAPEPDANGVYTNAEQLPVFRGGAEAMRTFLVRNLSFPATDSLPEGRVFIKFIVTKTGQLRAITLVKGIHPLLDAEALRVAFLMDGKFVPGRKAGEPVDVHYNIPITFSRAK